MSAGGDVHVKHCVFDFSTAGLGMTNRPPKRGREGPDTVASALDMSSLIDAMFDEKRVCVVGVPLTMDKDALVRVVEQFLRDKTAKKGALYAIVSAVVTVPKPGQTFSIGFLNFTRPEGATNCVGAKKMPLDGMPGKALSFKRPSNYRPCEARPYKEEWPTAISGMPGTIVAVEGTLGGLKNFGKITDVEFVRVFQNFGDVVALEHRRDGEKVSAGSLRVQFADTAAAQGAIRHLHGSQLKKGAKTWQIIATPSAVNKPLRTGLCDRLVLFGDCQKGGECAFSHDTTRIWCPAAAAGQRCDAGTACPFSHWTASDVSATAFAARFRLDTAASKWMSRRDEAASAVSVASAVQTFVEDTWRNVFD
jgi:hypothetical protein